MTEKKSRYGKEWISTTTAASEIDVEPRTIQKYCKSGSIEARKFGRLYVIDREIWEEWKARNITAAS